MVKVTSKFICQQCGYEQSRWFGKCPECGEWNSAVETVVEKDKLFSKSARKKTVRRKPLKLADVKKKSTKRTLTKISELDRVLGGGLVPGQVILIAGEPGIGKSTILLQVANNLGQVIYASGEESVHQIKIRADRLGVTSKKIEVMEETDVDEVIAQVMAASTPDLLVIDSIQTMATSDLSGMAGSVGQVRECTYRLVRLAKSMNIVVFIVGHVTKQGSIAGPAVLMHIVDSVLWFEGDKSLTLRVLRAVKNRFGPTDEVGIFSMVDKGLKSMDNPEKIFLSDNKKNIAGTALACVMEGTRPMLIEVQSLVTPSYLAYPKRIAQGIDPKRYELLLAVLQRRCGVPLYEQDCYTNIAGGMSIKGDPSADLAICLSLASAYFDKSLPKKSVSVGEVGLLGEIREVIAQDKRVREAKRLGHTDAITNKGIDFLAQAIKKYLK